MTRQMKRRQELDRWDMTAQIGHPGQVRGRTAGQDIRDRESQDGTAGP